MESKSDQADAFLNGAQQYHLAALNLLPHWREVEAPVYFLFTHAVELGLKAYLRSRSVATPRGPKGHALDDLLEQSVKAGLKVGVEVHDVVRLLQSENAKHGFRYFLFEGTARPAIAYLRQVADALLDQITREVRSKSAVGPSGVVMKFAVARPTKK